MEILIIKLTLISILITQNITWAYKPLQTLKKINKVDAFLRYIGLRSLIDCSKCTSVWVGLILALLFGLPPLEALTLISSSFLTNLITDYKWRIG